MVDGVFYNIRELNLKGKLFLEKNWRLNNQKWENIMEILNVDQINKMFGITPVLTDISFTIMKNDKIGIMGVNGAGKTTLLKIILGEIEPDTGHVIRQKNLKIGYMPQRVDYQSDKTAYEDALDVYNELLQAEIQLDKLQRELEKKHDKDTIRRFSALQERYIAQGGMVYRGKVRSMLIGLGLSDEEMDLPTMLLSGGQRTRVLLAKLLLTEPDILLLDEPTNHLDISAVEWLENFLQEYRGAVLVISHDRYFLDKFINRIFSLENHRIRAYKGNYSDFVRLKKEEEITLQRDYEKKTKEIKRIEGIIAQQKQWNTERSLITARHKQKMVDKIAQTLVCPEDAPKSIRLSFDAQLRSGNDVLTIENIGMAFDRTTLFSNVSFQIKRGERVFLLGRNGTGKTTLFRLILGELPLKQGKIRLGSNVQIGYYSQGQENLPLDKSILEAVYMNTKEQNLGKIRNVLASFLFTDEDVDKQISILSGGEKARVALAILMLSGCNLLMLDEPTNHLDIVSREILESALLEYNGTIFVISHDRYFIKKIATRILSLEQMGINSYEGGYDFYLQKMNENKILLSSTKLQKKASDAGVLYRQKRSAEAEKRKKKNDFTKLEKKITQLEETISFQKEQLTFPEIASDYTKILEITELLDKNERLLEQYYIEWEKLYEQL